MSHVIEHISYPTFFYSITDERQFVSKFFSLKVRREKSEKEEYKVISNFLIWNMQDEYF